MGKKLVIVESPAKSKTINKILGGDYIVKSSVGHVRDLPIKTLGVDIEDSFKPKYVIMPGKKKIISELKKAAEDCDVIYLAPDPDREGEAIAWHLSEVLKGGKKPHEILRVQFNEITPRAVRKAFETPGAIDINRVNAQQARRVLDRIVGYKVSPMLWQRLRRGLSAGRVQSVALRLVAEREAEITAFIPEEYWILGAKVRKLVAPIDPFQLKLTKIDGEKADVKNAEQSGKIRGELEKAELNVDEITIKDVKKNPYPPYITSTLQQAGSSYCSFTPKRTMGIAQKLYEGIDIGGDHVGLITYMRTDSFAIATDALTACRTFISDQFGNEYCPEKPNFYKSRSSAQEAHEAIRPTDVSRTPESLADKLAPAELKLYRLIWRRFVASQMVSAEIEQRTVKVKAAVPAGGGSEYLFQATSSDVKFPGYMKVMGVEQDDSKDGKDDDEHAKLPQLVTGEKLECLEWLADRKETKPPSRYSEASLIRALESNGVGRPSTYAQIIATLQDRKYVDTESRSLMPTELGKDVNKLLVDNLSELFDVHFTASMEDALDEIEKGSVVWTEMLKSFYEKFAAWMVKTELPPADHAVVLDVLSMFDGVTEWMPETKRGKRTYSDQKFIDSVKKQIDTGKKKVSQKQLTTLVKIACHYRSQVPGIEDMIKEKGFEEILSQPEQQPPLDTTLRKLALLVDVKMDERGTDFTASLRAQAESGRRLSPAQVNALNNVVLNYSEQIKDFDLIKSELSLVNPDAASDVESGPLLKAMADIVEWNPPVMRGKREFNDKSFFDSLNGQFEKRGYLSEKQRAALKKMISKYESQIAGFDELASKFSLKKKDTSAKR